MRHVRFSLFSLILLGGWHLTGSAQTDPPQAEIRPAATPGDFIIEWPNTSGFAYFVETSEDLVDWTFVPVAFWKPDAAAHPELYLGITPEAEGTKRFFRVVDSDDPSSGLLSTDYNGIGVSAWDQLQLGHNPFAWVDVLGNGLHDAWEEFYFGATGQNPAGNDDGDYTDNLEESELGLDPTVDETGMALTYTYDDAGRLTAVSGNSTALAYTLDEEGNITLAD